VSTPIPTAVIFAYATEGEALWVANNAIGKKLAVCEIRICSPKPARSARRGVPAIEADPLGIAKAPVAWVCLPVGAIE
jgi:hypothetical protein